MKNRNQNHSNHWKTSIYISRWIKENYGKCFDPCPYMAKFNGLNIHWQQLNFVNPGYDLETKTAFVKKAAMEMIDFNRTSLVLIPYTAETKLFHNYIYPYASKILIPKFRPQFAGFNTKGVYVTDQTGQNTIVLIVFDGKRNILEPMPKLEIWDLKKAK